MNKISDIDSVILCGGLGKRLRSEIGEAQKVMAQVKGVPFLDHHLASFKKQGIRRVILCTGYKADEVEDYYRQHSHDLAIEFSREDKPLGTGGAVKHARLFIESDLFLVINGDSFIEMDLSRLLNYHATKKAQATIVMAKVQDAKDFGTIVLDEQNRITQFNEKNSASAGYVNAGVYCFSKSVLDVMPAQENFSLEYDVFPRLAGGDIFGFPVDCSFIDIGTPQRFKKAQ